MYINNLGHMTKMAAMPIYGKNPSNIFFSETNRLISKKLGVNFFFLIQFYIPFKLFHSYRDESIGRWGENRSTRGKTT